MLRSSKKLSNFSTMFYRERSQLQTPPPNEHMTFLVDTNSICVASLKADFHSVGKSRDRLFAITFFSNACGQPHLLRLIACSSKESGRKKSIARLFRLNGNPPLEGILIKMLIAIPTFIYLVFFINVQVQNYSTVPSKEYQLNLTYVLLTFVPDRADYTGGNIK